MAKPDEVELRKRFDFNEVKGDEAERMNLVAAACLHMAGIFVAICPDGRELSLALTKLEEVETWAMNAIHRGSLTAEETAVFDQAKRLGFFDPLKFDE